MKHDHVRVAVWDADPPGSELVPARNLGDNQWELLQSPLYAMGLAAGDVVRILDDKTGQIEVLSRGGNVCVQLYLASYLDHSGTAMGADDETDITASVARDIASELKALGGWTDGSAPGLIAFSLPVDVGFPAIEKVFAAALLRYPGAEWQFSNVYDPTSGDPLGWWE